MSLAMVQSSAQVGTAAPEVTVEVFLARGLPSFSIVGLPETAVKESRDRVRAAIINSNFEFPSKRISVNLAPADLPKEGGRFDLPIALGVLAASGQIPIDELRDKSVYRGVDFSRRRASCYGIIDCCIGPQKHGTITGSPRQLCKPGGSG